MASASFIGCRGLFAFQGSPLDFLPAPTTELEAVNAILASISEAPLNTLEGFLETDAAIARAKLWEACRSLQTRSWSFNYEPAYTLGQDVEGKVAVPSNALRVVITGSTNYTVRGQYMYDTSTHSFTIGQDLSADITFFIPYDELPEHARRLVLLKAGKSFQDQQLGEAHLHQFTKEDIVEAQVSFMNAESRLMALNVASASPSVLRIRRNRVAL